MKPLPATAKALLATAGAIVLADVVLALLGGRAATSVLTGTTPGDEAWALIGALYAIAHLSAVIVAPIFALAALVRVGLGRFVREEREVAP